MLIRASRERTFSSLCNVDDTQLAGKKQNNDPMLKVLNKSVDLGEATSFLDHVYLGCTQRHWEPRKHVVAEPCSNPEFLEEKRKK